MRLDSLRQTCQILETENQTFHKKHRKEALSDMQFMHILTHIFFIRFINIT